MNFTDIFIRRPVLATVVSALILLFGLRAVMDMPIRQFPKMESTVISITTAYPGADAALVEGFVTSPIEAEISSAEGIEYMTSSSTMGVSSIECYIELNFDAQKAFTDITSKVAAVTNQLPDNAMQPVILKQQQTGDFASMYVGLDSTELTPEQITDYATRVVKPQLETVNGVAKAEILGAKTYAMRAFLDPAKMAAMGVTPNDVSDALYNNNYPTTAGSTKGLYVSISMRADTDLSDVNAFKNLIIKQSQNKKTNAIVRLQDVAKVELGSKDYNSSVILNGKKAIFIGMFVTPSANPLSVISDVKKLLPEIQKNFPPSLTAKVVYDATDFIRASIDEVVHTIGEAALIVVIVIFLFLGSLRSVLIPVITIPLSLIGVCSLMLVLGYSINLLTLLAMVLAIGLVVDDAIVVVENIFRHIEEGYKPFDAAILGAREIATPVIAMTITLAAVYAPIGFLGGITGALFKEFAFTLASAVIVSGVIALTLSPMMCSKILNHDIGEQKFVRFLDNFFTRLKIRYQKILVSVLNNRKMVVIFSLTVLASLPYLYLNTPQETAPAEDTGFVGIGMGFPQYATIDYVETYTKALYPIFDGIPEKRDYFIFNQTGGSFAGMILKTWDERKKTANDILGATQGQLEQIPGMQAHVFIPPLLPSNGDGVGFVVQSTGDYQTLFELTEQLLAKAQKSGLFMFVSNGLKYENPQSTLKINRSKAADLGLSMDAIGNALSSALSGGNTNNFNLMGRSYEVIPQLDRQYRLNPEQLEQIYIKTASGAMVALSTVASLEMKTEPNQLSHFQQLKSATLFGMMMPGRTVGEGVAYLQKEADNILPKGYSYDYLGEARQFVYENSALVAVFFFSILVIFLVLAAQFESFRDPFIILVSVPMSICGALIPLNLGMATINIYTQIGLITLIGLITKHGILMTDFANHLQKSKGLSPLEAIIEAASIRLRPILMTTASMIFGVIPLVCASGAGAASRYNIGLVISSGMLIGTCFTLLVVPTMYTFIAKKHSNNNHNVLEDQERTL